MASIVIFEDASLKAELCDMFVETWNQVPCRHACRTLHQPSAQCPVPSAQCRLAELARHVHGCVRFSELGDTHCPHYHSLARPHGHGGARGVSEAKLLHSRNPPKAAFGPSDTHGHTPRWPRWPCWPCWHVRATRPVCRCSRCTAPQQQTSLWQPVQAWASSWPRAGSGTR